MNDYNNLGLNAQLMPTTSPYARRQDTITAYDFDSRYVRNTITEMFVSNGAITTNKVGALAITSTKISGSAITTPKIDANAVTTNEIAASAVTAGKISVSYLSAINSNMGTLTAGLINGGTINATNAVINNINANNITTGTINANTINLINITANNINAGTLNASVVEVTNLDANKISSGTINASNIAVTNLNASNITTGNLSANYISGGTISSIVMNGNTITGGTIRTSSSGKRIELSSGDYINIYSATGGTNIGRIEESGNDLHIDSLNGRNIVINSASVLTLGGDSIYLDVGAGGICQILSAFLFDKSTSTNTSYYNLDLSTHALSGVTTITTSSWASLGGDLDMNGHDVNELDEIGWNTRSSNSSKSWALYMYNNSGYSLRTRMNSSTWSVDQTSA